MVAMRLRLTFPQNFFILFLLYCNTCHQLMTLALIACTNNAFCLQQFAPLTYKPTNRYCICLLSHAVPCFVMSYAVAVGIANLWRSCMNVNARIKQQQQKNNWVRCFNQPAKATLSFYFHKRNPLISTNAFESFQEFSR